MCHKTEFSDNVRHFTKEGIDILENLSLPRQMDMIFKQLEEELSYLSSGTVFLQIRNNAVGKFGIKHLPLEGRDGILEQSSKSGLTVYHLRSFRQMALEALKRKKGWTHGEIHLDFHIRQDLLCTSIQFESNYNMTCLTNENTSRRRAEV